MTTFAWHVHHELLVEPLTEPIENRIAFIKTNKPKREQATRLRLLRIVKGEMPAAHVAAWVKANAAWVKAAAARDKAVAAWDKAYAAWDKAAAARDKAVAARDKAVAAWDRAFAAWDKAAADNLPAIETLHRAECEPDCPWNGRTIFP